MIMGYNPHRQGPTPKKMKPFDISLFVDVYQAYEKEYGKEFMGKHIGMAAIYLDGVGQGKIECCGSLQNLQFLTCLLVMRLATVQARVVYEKSQGKENPGLKETAKSILDRIWGQLEKLEHFDHAFPPEKPNAGIAKATK
jgi:hypothetical protein